MSVNVKSKCLAIILASISAAATGTKCNKGEYVIKPLTGSIILCYKCDHETFMPETSHTHTECYNCSDVTDSTLEYVVSNCSQIKDTEIWCINGYYRKKAENPSAVSRCVQCTMCNGSTPYPILSCHGYNDTVCCPEMSHVVSYNEHGLPVCKISCGRGHYLDTNAETCKPCQDRTFQSEEGHRRSNCEDCYRILPGSHVTITTPCNSTHKAELSCEDGYFMVKNHYPVECDKCTVCAGEVLQNCSSTSDTVCSHSFTSPAVTKDLLTTPTPGIHQPRCQNGYYFDAASNTCTPCGHGTFLDEMNHNRTVCQNCSEFKGTERPITCVNNETSDSGSRYRVLVIVLPIIVAIIIIIIIVCCNRRIHLLLQQWRIVDCPCLKNVDCPCLKNKHSEQNHGGENSARDNNEMANFLHGTSSNPDENLSHQSSL